MKQALRYIKIILIALIVGPVAYGLLVEVVSSTPNYAVVLLDENKGIYHSPMHFIHDGKAEFPSGLKAVEFGDVESSKNKPDPECNDFFEPKTESLIWVWMEDYGVIPEPEHRWNRDGTWNY